MTKLFYSTLLLLLSITSQSVAQTTNLLRKEIQQIITTKNAVVGVSIVDDSDKEILSVNADERFPLQSVFKFHIAAVVLSEIDRGKLSLNQKIKIGKRDLLPDYYSPIKDKYPNGVTLTIAEILKYTVSASDNVGCDVLLRLIGGPDAVEKYFVKNKFKNLAVKINEEMQQGNWDLQFQNWTTPKAATEVLSAFYDNKKKLLSKSSYDFIWKTMKETETGKNRLKGQLPKETVVAHKTGTSGVNKTTGITAAVHDIGIVFLPNGRHYFISVFVTNSKENAETNEKIIADISKAGWDYFTVKTK